ncbi:MAG: aspartate--tRNA ligase [Myxococcales bacterium]|nr:aspartate--tRNA ligase [Myxococcales bacterium]
MSTAQPAFLVDLKRTHPCNALRTSDLGREVVLMGWVQNRRDHGGRVFIDLRDREGLTQVVFGPELNAEAHALAGDLRPEFCLAVAGKVVSRVSSGGQANPRLATGEVEIEAARLHIFSRAETPPFPIEDEIDTHEQLRLKYRYLDLRRPSLQRNFMKRSQLYRATRDYFHGERFVELETPFMVKYTPGGARNFLVPSRLNPGRFYALAESPQIFKQLFMVAGFDRYFQIVRCFRDEDLRLDRQPEFTQIDVEMSFVVEEDVYAIMEGLIARIWKDVLDVAIPGPFPRMSYDEAVGRYGVDKPDLRFGLPLTDITALVAAHGGANVPFFTSTLEANGTIKALRIPAEHASQLSRAELDKLEEFAKGFGAKGLARCKIGPAMEWAQTPLKAINDSPPARTALNEALGVAPGDIVFFQFGAAKNVNAVLGALRMHFGTRFQLIDKAAWKFLWVTDFPMFEKTDQGGWAAAHHPFTSPKPEHVQHLGVDNGKVQARAYDLVLNGNEIAGGSIRIHQRDVQQKVFEALGLEIEDLRAKFGFLLDAFKYGPPPHGGIAFGVDRLSMLLCGADSLRDVIAFPKTQKGTDLMTDCPTEVDAKQLDELSVRVKV